MAVCFLLGAGAEGEKQIGIPQGADFKKDVIMGKNIADFSKNFASICIKGETLDNGTILKHNSTSILYQTIIEKIDDYCDEKKKNDIIDKIVDEYFPGMDKRGVIKQYINKKPNGKKEYDKKSYEKFRKFYYKNIYEKLVNGKLDDNLDAFLCDAGVYGYYDSLFNYLRKPDLYSKEVFRVIKIYYGALKSIYNGMLKAAGLENDSSIYNKISNGECVDRESVIECIDKIEENVIENIKNSNTYYHMIKNFYDNNPNIDVWVVTTNYTHFAEKIIGVKEPHMSYLHGEFGKFENLYTKEIGRLRDFNPNDLVFPYLLVQSGVKPIINYSQIKSMYNGCSDMLNAEKLVVLGYGLNSDDEHIINIIRERLRNNREIIIFIHGNQNEYNSTKHYIGKLLGEDVNIKFEHTNNFYNYINEALYTLG